MRIKEILTSQEKFWKGNFGDKYFTRNKKIYLKSNRNIFNLALKKVKGINSCIELGAGAGNNIISLKKKLMLMKFNTLIIKI